MTTAIDTDALRAELIRLLKDHDWEYQYSDDYGVYRAGADRYGKIMSLVGQLADGVEVHNAHAPAYYRLRVSP